MMPRMMPRMCHQKILLARVLPAAVLRRLRNLSPQFHPKKATQKDGKGLD